MTTRRASVTSAAGAVVLLTALSGWAVNVDETPEPFSDTVVTTTTAAPLPATTVPLDGPYAQLAAVIPKELEGYRVETGARATGPLDLEAAVAAESDTHAERSVLETRKFERGYARSFTNETVDVYMAAYDFATPNDAALYMNDGFITLYGKGAGTYDVTDVPGARGFSQGTESDGRPAIVHGVVFTKADRFVLVFTRSASTLTPAEASRHASTLYARA